MLHVSAVRTSSQCLLALFSLGQGEFQPPGCMWSTWPDWISLLAAYLALSRSIHHLLDWFYAFTLFNPRNSKTVTSMLASIAMNSPAPLISLSVGMNYCRVRVGYVQIGWIRVITQKMMSKVMNIDILYRRYAHHVIRSYIPGARYIYRLRTCNSSLRLAPIIHIL